MAKLRCESLAERVHIPAFIFFFQMLYPFAWVNDRERSTAAAAGGCMLVRRDALHAAGGIEAIRDALIDDCALARLHEAQGPIWLGADRARDQHPPLPGLGDIRRMVARSAYAQLNYSPLLLAGTIAGHRAHLSGAAAARAVRRRLARNVGLACLGADGALVSADPALLSASRRCGVWRCR